MRVTRASVTALSVVTEPVTTARGRWSERRCLLLRLWDEEGHGGRGEAAPLPGYSPDGLEDARQALAAAPWEGLELALDAPILPQISHAVARIDAGVPSARFALETALLDLAAHRLDRPVWALLSEEGIAREVPVASLVPIEAVRFHALCDQAIAAGHGTIKVKIGRRLDRELPVLQALRAKVGAGLRLRLDANHSLEGPRLARHLAALAPLEPEVVEEPAPLSEVLDLPRIPVPLGVDETLHGGGAELAFGHVGAEGIYRYVILKPMTLGGVLPARELARRARARGAIPIVSHLFEGPVGWAAAAALAVTLPASPCAAGLGAHAALAAFASEPLPMLRGASIVPWESPGLGLPPTPGRAG